jgi:hypothetical protein
MATRKADQRSLTETTKRGGRLGPGQAPPVGLENAQKARENIRAKLSLIGDWVKEIALSENSISRVALAPFSALPRSQREFNAWDSSTLPSSVISIHGPFHKNANTTLLKNQDLLSSLRQYFAVLKQSETEAPARRKQESIASLQRRLTMEKTLRDIAEKDLVRVRAKLWQSQKEEEILRAELRSAETKAVEMIEELQQLLAQVSAERAELIRTVKKVSGIRKIPT